MFKCLTENSKEDGARLFSVVPSHLTRGNVHKLKHRKFLLNLRKIILFVGLVKHWKRLSGHCGVLICEILKTLLERPEET